MNDINSIEVKSLSKKFDIKYTTFYGGIAKSGTKSVLDNISFEIKKGEVFGIIGRNGSGKSTLLKIITGILYPDTGKIINNGKVASILELGMGFEPELTGRNNIHIKCGMYGLSSKEINDIIDEIIEFSELGEQIDHPLRTYSSGMTAKLAFSILIHMKYDILIIDEILSVGDASFNAKCKMIFNKMKKEKKTIIVASHNMSTLEEMCDRIMWIESGHVKEIGDAISVCYHYHSDLTNSYDTICSLAESGDTTSQNRAGIMCRDGIGTPKNIDKAIEWFTRASNMGFIDAQLNLADIKIKLGDKHGAIELYKKASDAGNAIAISKLLSITSKSVDITNSLIIRIREESSNGNIRAKKLLADLLFNGTVVLKDQTEAYQLYLKCAESGNIPSQLIIGSCNRDGIGTQKNGKEAMKWFSIAAHNGNIRAMLELAMIYRKGIDVEKNIVKSIEWYKAAAHCGDINAMFQLGMIYRNGSEIDIDVAQSEYWLSQYAKQGRLSTEVAFGDILKQGYLGQKQKECIMWYEDAAKEGNLNAILNMAIHNRDGILLPADSAKAIEWYSRATEMQSSVGLLELGNHYLKGNGIQRDPGKAFELIKRSADMGNVYAMFQLAIMYKDAIGTKRNISESKQILTLLTESGNMNARTILTTIDDE